MRWVFYIIAFYEFPLLILGSLMLSYYGPIIVSCVAGLGAGIYADREQELRTRGNMAGPVPPDRRKKAQEKIVSDFSEMRKREVNS
jgi:hypothetical protein